MTRILLPIEPALLRKVAAYQKRAGLKGRAAAIRQLVGQGLAGGGLLGPALRELRALRPALEARGVAHAGIFGSVARGEDGPESDVDVGVVLAEDRRIDLFAFAAIMADIEARLGAALGRKVQATDFGNLRDVIAPSAARDFIQAF